MKIKTRNIIIAIILALIGIFIFGYISGKKKGDRASQAVISSLNSTLLTYSTTLNKTKVTVSQQEQLILTQREAIKKDSLTREELRKLNLSQVNEISRLKFRIDTLIQDISHNGQVVHLDTVFLDKRTGNAILLPFEFTKKDQFLNLMGSFDGNGKLDLSIKMDVGVDLYLGTDKTTKKPTASLVSNNTYLNTLSINSIKMDTPKDKRYGIGLQGGYGVMFGSPLRSGFYLGAGFSYSIIRW